MILCRCIRNVGPIYLQLFAAGFQLLLKTYKPLEPTEFKGSFKGDIGPCKAHIGLYWQYFGASSSCQPFEPSKRIL